MTNAERQMVLYLVYDGGADTCKVCVHCDKPTCPLYLSPEQEGADYNEDERHKHDDYCIDGMVAYFEKGETGR